MLYFLAFMIGVFGLYRAYLQIKIARKGLEKFDKE